MSEIEMNATLSALDRLMKMFAVERYVYLALTSVSFLLMLYAIIQLVTKQSLTTEMAVSIFGPSSLVAFSSARISVFFNRAFGVFEQIVKGNAK